jgi:hypothetical protein
LSGRYDLTVPAENDYIIAPLLVSYLFDNGLQFQAQPANLQVTNFEITLAFPDGTVLSFAEPLVNPYQVTTSLLLTASQARGGSSQGVAVGVGIPSSYKDALRAVMAESSTILMNVRAIGTTYGGFTQKSAAFSWPILLCEGCDTQDVCTPDQADASCLPGQDVWPYCTTIVDPTATP